MVQRAALDHDCLWERYEPTPEGLFWRGTDRLVGWEDPQGYRHCRIGGRIYLAHRLVFFMHYGYMPELVDHKDRNPRNNFIENLRDATKQVNAINSGIPANNNSGIKGVSWNKAAGKWTAQIKHNGVKYHLGCYELLRDAAEARLRAEKEFWSDLE